jgi:PAS domain S-box-containing protein
MLTNYNYFWYYPTVSNMSPGKEGSGKRGKVKEVPVALEQSLNDLIFNTMKHGVIIRDAEGSVIHANKAAETILGVTLEQMKNNGPYDPRWKTIHEDGSPYPTEAHPANLAFKTGKKITNIVMGVFNPVTDSIHWITIDTIPLSRETGKPVDIVCMIFDDITEEVQARNIAADAEHKYQEVFHNIHDGIIVYEINSDGSLGTIIEVNKVIYTKLGYTRNELLALKPGDIGHKDLFSNAGVIMKMLREHGKIVFEDKLIHKDGRSIPFRLELYYVHLSGGKRAITVAHDLSEKKSIELRLHRSEENYRNVFNSSNDLMLVIQDGEIKLANSKVLERMGHDPKEVIGKPFIDFVLRNGDKTLTEQYQMGLRGEEVPEHYSVTHKLPGGQTVNLDINVVETTFRDRPAQMIVAHDVTERVIAGEKLKEAMERAQESDQLKTAFLASISHELRTPLNHIIGLSSVVDSSTPADEMVTYFEKIKKSGSNLLAIIDDIFELAYLSTDRITLQNEAAPISKIFFSGKSILEELLWRSGKDKISLIFKPELSHIDTEINIDTLKVSQVLTNLFKNAIKYTVHGFIEFGFRMEVPDSVSFYVKDTGIGIDKSKQTLIFEMFRQGEDNFSKSFGGIGIGLTLSTKLTDLMGGKITVDSEPCKGSTFTLVLPKKAVFIKG